MMKINEIRTGTLVMVSSLIESEIDGVKRRRGALGMVEAPVFGTGGMWWWIIHQDGSQIKYRYCEISELKTIKLPPSETMKEKAAAQEAEEMREMKMEKEEEERPVRYGWVYDTVENWID